jgi:hypothetical protein
MVLKQAITTNKLLNLIFCCNQFDQHVGKRASKKYLIARRDHNTLLLFRPQDTSSSITAPFIPIVEYLLRLISFIY